MSEKKVEAQDFPLMKYSKGSGCGCKIAPAVLEQILKSENNFFDTNLLVGNESRDDAAVYDIGDGKCLISTTDFFTPIVDDAFDFGRIAAANAISDIYAMGGKPLMAIAILGWPIEKIPVEVAGRVLEGGKAICSAAGIALAGGHSIDITEPVFGLAVSGIADKKNIKKNNSAENGDVIYLTKPIGTGVLSSAKKKGVLSDEHYKSLLKSLLQLNSIGLVLGEKDYVHAMTDVTGFSLTGHLLEMTETSNLTAIIEKDQLPKLDGFDTYAAQFIYPGNTTRNFNAFDQKCSGMKDLDFLLLCDPQTNGGLLIAVDENKTAEFESVMNNEKQFFRRIGKIVNREDKIVKFV